MSFGASNTTKTGMNDIGGTFNTAVNQQLPMFNRQGTNLFNLGTQTTQPGVNFLNQILQGNRAAATSLFQPQINQITGNQQTALNAINTLMPRGGGRFASQYAQALQPLTQIQNLFNPTQATAAQALPQIGLQETGQGINLFNLGNQALQTGAGAAGALTQAGQRQQEITNSLISSLGGGLLGLATLPLGGAGGLLGTALGGLVKPTTPPFNPWGTSNPNPFATWDVSSGIPLGGTNLFNMQ